ncbi:MAG: hypothetical protein M3Q29_10110 [Chloroflexota bacterium]|nr:hypothetical protein [Chloroflexota bacterium]
MIRIQDTADRERKVRSYMELTRVALRRVREAWEEGSPAGEGLIDPVVWTRTEYEVAALARWHTEGSLTADEGAEWLELSAEISESADAARALGLPELLPGHPPI